jgi:mutator protein MutT
MLEKAPIVVVCGLLQQEEKFLLVQRGAQQQHAFQWEFPGGKVEAGEEAAAALQREWQEELGVEIQVGAALPSVLVKKSPFTILLLPFYCQLVRGRIVLTEHVQQAWCSPEEALKKELSWGDRRILERIIR